MDYIKAHKKSINNKQELKNSKKCGCFNCLNIFNPNEINNWIADTDGTAICPYCNIDSVIAENDELKITKEFLNEMHRYWFGVL